MSRQAYRQLARRLDALPNGFPPTASGVELQLLATFFSEDEAALAAGLRLTPETADQIAARLDRPVTELHPLLNDMLRRGMIRPGRAEGGRAESGRAESGLGFALKPFVVGIYEALLGEISAEQAQLFEAYYQQAFGSMLQVQPPVHRVIPVNESVQNDMAVHPYESAAAIVDGMESWGVIDCICRRQKAHIGDPCAHPVDVCLILSEFPNAFSGHPLIRNLTQADAARTLRRAAAAGLVHSVSNNQQGVHYICNCCTCSCGILRGMAELGIANVVARSAFVNQVDAAACIGCEDCIPACQFDALALTDDFVVAVDRRRCVGCGVCVGQCREDALVLVRRPEEEVKPPPPTMADWGRARARYRELDLAPVL